MRRCPRCKTEKSLDEFYARAGKPSTWCKICNREHVKKWQQANPERVLDMRSNGKLRKYGVTPEQYWKMFDDQGGRCAACKGDQPSVFIARRRRFDLDHNHATGETRGLLCQPCNLVVGLMRDDPNRMRGVLSYLERYA